MRTGYSSAHGLLQFVAIFFAMSSFELHLPLIVTTHFTLWRRCFAFTRQLESVHVNCTTHDFGAPSAGLGSILHTPIHDGRAALIAFFIASLLYACMAGSAQAHDGGARRDGLEGLMIHDMHGKLIRNPPYRFQLIGMNRYDGAKKISATQ